MVYIDEQGTKYFWVSVFRLGTNEYGVTERALALYLEKFPKTDTFYFGIDNFIVPEDFPNTELYEWESIDLAWMPKILTYQGYRYPAQDKDSLMKKFKIYNQE